MKERARATMTPPRAAREKRNQNHFTVVTTDTEPMYRAMIHTPVKGKFSASHHVFSTSLDLHVLKTYIYHWADEYK